MSSHSSFGIDLNSSSYELHPSPKDSPETLQGNHFSTIRFSEGISSQILDFVENNTGKCHPGMTIGTVQFIKPCKGKISFNVIHDGLSNCDLTITKEAGGINTEIYGTEYDEPPSNAMFLRRKGFVYSKLTIKPGCSNDQSLQSIQSLKNRNSSSQRATTTFKTVRGSQRFNNKQRNNKRRLEHLNGGPPNKRLKSNINLIEAIGEILFVGQATFDRIKSIISSRTSMNINNLQYELNQIADYHGPNKCYYLKNNKQIYDGINWENSTVLTESEKQLIRNRTKQKSNNTNNNKIINGAKTNDDDDNNNNNNNDNDNNNKNDDNDTSSKSNCFESKYVIISDETMYAKYDEIYNSKFNQMNVYIKSYKENTDYFHQMRAMINKESNKEKRKKMTGEFRQIFESRKGELNRMKASIDKLKVELAFIKTRINAYVNKQHQLQQQKSI